MGGKTSRLPSPKNEGEGGGGGGGGQSGEASSSGARPTPYIEAPYAGPWAEYQFIDVTVPVMADVTFTSDVTMSSTQASSVLSALCGTYSQGYSLVTICRVPGGAGGGGGNHQRQVFVPGKEVQYQGIFCRYEGDPGNEGWKLRAEKSLLLAHHVTPGMVSAEAGPGSQHVEQLISRTAQTGGRLLTVQWSGQPLSSDSDSALGVDVFLEVPDQSLPERSVYQLVTAPAAIVKRSLFASKGHVTCDWNGILTRHLARGWRLVDIFCESSSVSAGMSSTLSPANAKIQTVWFFEKPESRARDDSAVYEGSIVEHWIDVSSASSSSSIIPGSAASCLGSGRVDCKKGGSTFGKKTFTKRIASLKKKNDDVTRAEGDVKDNDDVKEESGEQKNKTSDPNTPTSSSQTDIPNSDKNHINDPPSQTIPPQAPNASQSAGWEGVIRSMGEKGWELASIVNTMDTQVVSGRSKVKVLLVFQRRISLAMSVKGRRTSDGLALRADTGASTSMMCDIPMMTGETSSHLNPSLAVRLPLSRSASRDHDDFQAASCDDDIPSTIGGASCSRTVSATDLSSTGRGLDGMFLDPGRRGSGKDMGLLLQPKGSSLGDEASIGTAGRSSTSSQHSRVTAAEVHITTSGGEATSSEEKTIDSDEKLSNHRADSDKLSSQEEGDGDCSEKLSNQGQGDIDSGEGLSNQKEGNKDSGDDISNQNQDNNDSSQPIDQSTDARSEKEPTPQITVGNLLEQTKEVLAIMTAEKEEETVKEQTRTVYPENAAGASFNPESIELVQHTSQKTGAGEEDTETDKEKTETSQDSGSDDNTPIPADVSETVDTVSENDAQQTDAASLVV